MPDERHTYSASIIAASGMHGAVVDLTTLSDSFSIDLPATTPDQATLRTLGPPADVAAEDLREARWGIVWPPAPCTRAEEAHRAALRPLIAHRRQQMGGFAVREFTYDPAWANDYDGFLWAAGPHVERGHLRPEKVPYYLCLVASPERIPWRFQQALAAEYAVGRLWFDEPSDCALYVRHLLAYETTRHVPGARRALLVGPCHPNDPATEQSSHSFLRPLHHALGTRFPPVSFELSLFSGSENPGAYKADVLGHFSRCVPAGKRPALVFTAGHGAEFSPSTTQVEKQGALLFQDWPGPGTPASPAHYWAGGQLSDTLSLHGTMLFSFACFSAGTPLVEDWVQPTMLRKSRRIALYPFVARLPQRLMARGLLGFIGHVSRAWTHSFKGVLLHQPQFVPFRSTLVQLMRGHRVGHAVDDLNRQASALTARLYEMTCNRSAYTPAHRAATWLTQHDLRGYVVLGDPAVRLRVEALA